LDIFEKALPDLIQFTQALGATIIVSMTSGKPISALEIMPVTSNQLVATGVAKRSMLPNATVDDPVLQLSEEPEEESAPDEPPVSAYFGPGLAARLHRHMDQQRSKRDRQSEEDEEQARPAKKQKKQKAAKGVSGTTQEPKQAQLIQPPTVEPPALVSPLSCSSCHPANSPTEPPGATIQAFFCEIAEPPTRGGDGNFKGDGEFQGSERKERNTWLKCAAR
jgi:hypothetical protein